VLDYDGTLCEFHVDRMKAFPAPGVVETLSAIRDSGRTSLSIMSGRPISELLELLGDLGIPMCGSQGTEFRSADGEMSYYSLAGRQRERIARAEREATAVAVEGRVERKISSVALHTRGVGDAAAAREEAEIARMWSLDAAEYGLEVRPFKGGIELRLLGVDKGTALDRVLEKSPSDSLCVYLGDDQTDEDAFEAIRGRGYGIKVGREEGPTAAVGRLGGPGDVSEFLKRWLSATTST
jgi:trehalose-phosphatase